MWLQQPSSPIIRYLPVTTQQVRTLSVLHSHFVPPLPDITTHPATVNKTSPRYCTQPLMLPALAPKLHPPASIHAETTNSKRVPLVRGYYTFLCENYVFDYCCSSRRVDDDLCDEEVPLSFIVRVTRRHVCVYAKFRWSLSNIFQRSLMPVSACKRESVS